MPEVQVFIKEDMEFEADFDDVYCDGGDEHGTSGLDSKNDDDLTSLSGSEFRHFHGYPDCTVE